MNLLGFAGVKLSIIDESQQGLKAFTSSIGEAEKNSNRLVNSANKINSSFSNSFKNADSESKKFSASLSELGAAIESSFIPLVAGGGILAGGIKSFAEMDGAMKRLETVSSSTSGNIKADMEASQKIARELSKTFAFSGTEIADAMYNLASSGLDTKNVIGLIGGATTLATAGLGNLKDTTYLYGAVLNQFGKQLDAQFTTPLEKGNYISDIFAHTVKKFQTDLPTLTEAFKYAGSSASTFNIDMADLLAMIGQLQSSGLKGSQAGTALSASFIDLSKASRELGVDIADTDGTLRNIFSIYEDIGKKMAYATTESGQLVLTQQSVNKLFEIFGDRGGRAAAIILQNTDAIKKHSSEIRNGVGHAKSMADTINSGLNKQLEILKNSISGAGRELATSLVPSLIGASNAIKGSIEYLRGLSGWQRQTIETSAKLAGSIGALGLGYLTVGKVGKSVIGIFSGMNNVLLSTIGLNYKSASATTADTIASGLNTKSKILNAGVSKAASIAVINEAKTRVASTSSIGAQMLATNGLTVSQGLAAKASLFLTSAMHKIPFIALAAGAVYLGKVMGQFVGNLITGGNETKKLKNNFEELDEETLKLIPGVEEWQELLAETETTLKTTGSSIQMLNQKVRTSQDTFNSLNNTIENFGSAGLYANAIASDMIMEIVNLENQIRKTENEYAGLEEIISIIGEENTTDNQIKEMEGYAKSIELAKDKVVNLSQRLSELENIRKEFSDNFEFNIDTKTLYQTIDRLSNDLGSAFAGGDFKKSLSDMLQKDFDEVMSKGLNASNITNTNKEIENLKNKQVELSKAIKDTATPKEELDKFNSELKLVESNLGNAENRLKDFQRTGSTFSSNILGKDFQNNILISQQILNDLNKELIEGSNKGSINFDKLDGQIYSAFETAKAGGIDYIRTIEKIENATQRAMNLKLAIIDPFGGLDKALTEINKINSEFGKIKTETSRSQFQIGIDTKNFDYAKKAFSEILIESTLLNKISPKIAVESLLKAKSEATTLKDELLKSNNIKFERFKSIQSDLSRIKSISSEIFGLWTSGAEEKFSMSLAQGDYQTAQKQIELMKTSAEKMQDIEPTQMYKGLDEALQKAEELKTAMSETGANTSGLDNLIQSIERGKESAYKLSISPTGDFGSFQEITKDAEAKQIESLLAERWSLLNQTTDYSKNISQFNPQEYFTGMETINTEFQKTDELITGLLERSGQLFINPPQSILDFQMQENLLLDEKIRKLEIQKGLMTELAGFSSGMILAGEKQINQSDTQLVSDKKVIENNFNVQAESNINVKFDYDDLKNRVEEATREAFEKQMARIRVAKLGRQ